jgi:hypothetical protein
MSKDDGRMHWGVQLGICVALIGLMLLGIDSMLRMLAG